LARRVTLKEVSQHAGVSFQTVSKVLNRQAKVSTETEKRIMDSVRALGYKPNLLARSLRSQRSYLIGYTWAPTPPGQLNTILDQFLHSMVQAAESASHHLLTFPYQKGDKWVDGYRELIDTNRVDGFILSSIEFNDPRIPFLQEQNFPFVAFGRSSPDWDFPYVDIDGAAGIEMAVDHLTEQGHTRIAALVWPEISRVGQNREDGLRRGFQKRGIPLPEEWLARGEGTYEFGFQTTQRWLESPKQNWPTALVAFNDPMAIGAMHAIQGKGLSVGTDIAVTGFDDAPMVQYLMPALTSIRQPIWEVGQAVMTILLEILHSAEAETGEYENAHILLPPRLIVRSSSLGWSPSQ
jgi:DNA-binding LacI/PurR family transcriptional regulator